MSAAAGTLFDTTARRCHHRLTREHRQGHRREHAQPAPVGDLLAQARHWREVRAAINEREGEGRPSRSRPNTPPRDRNGWWTNPQGFRQDRTSSSARGLKPTSADGGASPTTSAESPREQRHRQQLAISMAAGRWRGKDAEISIVSSIGGLGATSDRRLQHLQRAPLQLAATWPTDLVRTASGQTASRRPTRPTSPARSGRTGEISVDRKRAARRSASRTRSPARVFWPLRRGPHDRKGRDRRRGRHGLRRLGSNNFADGKSGRGS